MLKPSLFQRLRPRIARLPGAKRFYDALRLLFRPTYREDGLVTVHNADFLRDPLFQHAYEAAIRQQSGVNIQWRAHVTQWAGYHAKGLRGDFVECGVNRAFLSTSLMAYVDFKSMSDRKFYLFDTFSGLVPELVTGDDKAAYRNEYPDCYEFVRTSFKDYPNVVIVRGPVPLTLSEVDIRRVAYLSIDMNCAGPEEEALRYFWPKMESGGIIVLDDYGFSGHESQKRAADEFAAFVGVKVLSLPTGQGVILKP
jgi:macrocin-O-methyltransferase TylF-like protien